MKRLLMTALLAACTADAPPPDPAHDEWDDKLAEREVDYNAALRIAALRLTGELPTLVELDAIASAPDAVTAVVRGDAQMYFAPVNLSKEMAEAGKVIAIASATAKRLEEMPSVPTFTEAGLPYVYDSWFGLMTQSGVPRPIRS